LWEEYIQSRCAGASAEEEIENEKLLKDFTGVYPPNEVSEKIERG